MPLSFNPYGTTTQSQNLRVIGSALEPSYRAKNDTLEFNTDYAVTPSLTLTSQTGYNKDFLYSTEAITLIASTRFPAPSSHRMIP